MAPRAPLSEITRDETRVRFVEGIPGFQKAQLWEVLSQPDLLPLLWLRAVDGTPVRLLVVEPSLALTGYAPPLSLSDLRRAGLAPGEPYILLVIATIWEDQTVTANLRAPLLINPVAMRGAQIVLESSDWPLRHLLGRTE